MPDLTLLSAPQRDIYALFQEGYTREAIATYLDTTLAVVNAQLTRIKNKDFALGDEGTKTAVAPGTPLASRPAAPAATGMRPPRSGPSSNEEIARQLEQNGAFAPAELEQAARKLGESFTRDVHPMLLLGCTIQFTRFAGGRMSAHQLIEDVYSALRGFVQGTQPVPGDDGVVEPLPQTDRERLRFLEEQNRLLTQQLQELRQRVRGDTPSYSLS